MGLELWVSGVQRRRRRRRRKFPICVKAAAQKEWAGAWKLRFRTKDHRARIWALSQGFVPQR